MSFEAPLELSVIVPVYNEEAEIPRFLRAMALQRGIRFEVIISDGGSSDRTISTARRLSQPLHVPMTVVEGAKGRARQMNAAAALAKAKTLLFVHIDSSFPDPLAFRKGVDALSAATALNPRTAGHFALQFHFEGTTPLPFRFYGAKASLDRPGCTHGDQGLLISADFFGEIGPFDPALPLMEDTFLAERIRQAGQWLLLPSPIRTSPRRFQSEGLLPRQTLNAILMNLAALGRFDLIDALKESYRSQDEAKRLKLRPFLETLRIRIAALPEEERRKLWTGTGSYVRSNAWQIPFFLDLLAGIKGEGKGGGFLALHDRLIGRLIDNPVGDRGAALLVWVWFRLALLVSR